MGSTIDPFADFIFEAVGTDVSAKGATDVAPRTDEDWEKVRTGAVGLAEGIYLLKIPRPLATSGDERDARRPNPTELSPLEFLTKRNKDLVLWNAKIEALRNVAIEVLDIVRRKDAQQLFAAGGDLDQACEGCHLEYWYPGERERRERRREAAQEPVTTR